MSYSNITLEQHDNIAILTLNRPHRLNAISQTMLEEIKEALDHVQHDDSCHVLVVTGAGKAFSSGFDLQDQAANTPKGHEAWKPVLQKDFDGVMGFWNIPKPTIAAVNGHALAGGCEMAMACDITIAARSAIFGEPEVKFGAGIVVMLLPWLVGPKKAKEIAFLGEDGITADQALEYGMINQVVDDEKLQQTALKMAQKIALVDPMVMQKTKQQINESMQLAGMEHALHRALEIDGDLEGIGSQDKAIFLDILRKEGLKAALVWRDTRFTQ